MTEEKLERGLQKPRKRQWIRLIGASLLLFVALLVIFRQHVAGGIAQSICGGQQLACKLKVSRLDFGGLTLSNVEIRNPKSPNPALTASRVAVDLNWASIFSPTASFIGGDEIVLRIDLTGARPILGDLDAAVKTFTGGGGKPGPMPKLDFKSVRVIGDTLLGPVEAKGTVVATGPDAFVISLVAPAARLGLYGAELDLNGAEFNATVKGETISARATLGLDTFRARDAVIEDVKLDATLEQSAGVLRGNGTASLGEIKLDDTKLARAEAKAVVESAAVDPAAFDFNAWVRQVRRLSLNASAGAGTIGDASWDKGTLTAKIEPKAQGGSGGDFAFNATKVKVTQGAADSVSVKGVIDLPSSGRPRADGVQTATNVVLTAAQRNDLAAAVSDPFEAALPTFAAALKRAAERAGQDFDVTAPWSIAQTEQGYDISMQSGAGLKSASGFALIASANPGAKEVATWSTEEGGRWKAAGSLKASGGGAPTLTVDLGKASGAGEIMSMSGAARLASWKVGDDVLAAEASGLQFDTTTDGGVAGGQFTLRLDGGLGGGVWKAARATGQIKTAWTADTFYADAPRGLVIQWDEGKYGGTVLGAGALHYTPKGRLAEQQGKAVVGQGALARMALPVRAEGYSANATLGATSLNWRAEGGVRIGFDAAPSAIDFKMAERNVPATIDDISGVLDLRKGWRVTGQFRNANAKTEEASIAGLGAKFDLGGAGDELNGGLSNIAMRIFDPNPETTRRYEEVKFSGAATLKDSVASFSGEFTLAKIGVQIGAVSGKHSLKTGNGDLAFAPTPLIFVPRAFEPANLSPFLRGPAGVTGRVDVSGGASWTPDAVKTSATVDLKGAGFTLASVGIFEGVKGKVEISDLLNMKSAPNQTITIDKITLGMPIEKGAIHFQLIGFDAIRIEGAEWPFVGGHIRVKPTDFKFNEEEKRVVAAADKWDLNAIVEQFKIPDVKLKGTVSGDIPVVFSTGSARIDNASLMASQDGGVIQYAGSTADAAAQSDSNAKMLFDALKDFRYQVLKVGVNGDIAGRIVLSLELLGRNPTVLDGAQFQLGISIDGALMELANTAQGRFRLSDAITGGVNADRANPTGNTTDNGAPN